MPARRRRVPIEVVEAEASSSNCIVTTDAITPISSRSLRSDIEAALPTPLPSPAREPPQAKKHPSPALDSPSITPIPSVRGGIFRPTGQHTLFGSEAPSSDPSIPTFQPNTPVMQDDDTPRPSPVSLFEFTRTWEVALPAERWDLLCVSSFEFTMFITFIDEIWSRKFLLSVSLLSSRRRSKQRYSRRCLKFVLS